MKVSLIVLAILGMVSANSEADIPDRYNTEKGDQLMRLLITKGFAKEKEDDIDKKCGCDCTCCQARNSQYWINHDGAKKAAREYVGKNLHLSGQKLEDFINLHFEDKWYQFDVLKTGEIEIEQMSSLLKQTMGDMTIPI